MTMRKLIASTTKNTPNLQAKVAKRIFQAGSLGRGTGLAAIPADPKKPFIVFRELDTISSRVAQLLGRNTSTTVYQIYVHDERGGYSRIDQILDVLRETVKGLTDQVSDTGARCLEATWNSTSGDTEDPTYDSNMKFATITLVSSE
jgi:hypothetical protein